jgi:hypothetical protein
VDPNGEYVAWTIMREGRPYIAMKSAKEGSWVTPTLLGEKYTKAYFCDWTEGGEMLANVQEFGVNKLVVMRRDGTMTRGLPTEVPPLDGVCATWRKYEHR